MRRRWCIVALAVAASSMSLPAVPAAGAKTPRPAARSFPSRMLVYAQEWSLWPSRSSLSAGTVTVQLWNRGMDAHDLRIRRRGATGALIGRMQGVRTTQSGQLHQSTWKLTAGTYELYCSMPGHAAAGMRVTLHVR